MNYATQMEAARKGFLTEQMIAVAEKDAENLIRLTEGLLADMKEILAGN